MLAVLGVVWPRIPDLRYRKLGVRNFAGSVMIGAIVFVAWVVPDRLFPGYRHNFLFENFLTELRRPGFRKPPALSRSSCGCAPFER